MTIRSQIKSVAHYVPSRVATNHDLSKLMSTSDEWITERTGIKERRYVEPGVSSAMLGVEAALQAIAKAGIDKNSIDLIVASTLSPDMYFPGIGVLIQEKLGLPNVPALDIRAQCSGLVYGISTVDAFVRSGQAKRVLLVCAEVQSPVLDMTDRGREMAVLFGDGAGALIIDAEKGELSPVGGNQVRGVIGSLLGSDGSGAQVLAMKYPGTAHIPFVSSEMLEQHLFHPSMDGRLVFKNAVHRMCETAEQLLKKFMINPRDVNLLFPHQANLRINEAVREKLGLPPERVFNNIQKYGNTTSATIPICMSEAVAEGKLKSGDLIMTLAFGAGFTWGGNLIRW